MENIKIGLQIDSNTKSETADAKKLNEQLKQAAESASKIRVSGGVAARAAAQPGGAMSSSRPVGSEEVREYGALRGTAGATGASARDFANQAQGLSGLVRLYAIYAANVYAVTAAFNALSRAMDTTNMIRGLDQLGAASGRSLQGLAKQFEIAAGSAISSREAIEAVAKTSAAGLSSRDIIRLGTAAQKASAALGLNLTDAVSRLSRGITKLEPELLDELGIFTKIEPAVEKYARGLGKASSQLSDFERRQAFASAVLEEAEQKFGNIEIDANPYTKLAATFANLAQSGLELVNKVLTPIVNILNSNPVALAAVITAFGVSILKSTIPALKDFNKSLRDLQERTGEKAQAKYKEGLARLIDIPKLEETKNQLNKVADNLGNEFEKTKAYLTKRLERIGPVDLKVQKLLNILPGEAFDPKKAQTLLSAVLKSGQDQKLISAYINSMQAVADADEKVSKLYEQTNQKINQRYGFFKRLFDPVANLQEQANKAYLAGVKSSIIGNSLQTASTESLSKAFKELYGSVKKAGEVTVFREELKQIDRNGKEVTKVITRNEQGLGKFAQITTFAAGSAAILSTTIGRAGSALLGLLPYVGLAIGAFEILKQLFDTSQKESERYSQSLGVLNSAVENVDKTLEALSKRKAEKFYDMDSVIALTNAFTDLSKSLEEVIDTSKKLYLAKSGFSRFLDEAASFVTFGLVKTDEEKLATALSESLTRAVISAQKSGNFDEISTRLSETFKIKKEDLQEAAKGGITSLNDFIKSEISATAGKTDSFDQLIIKAEKAADLTKTFASKGQESADKLTAVKTGLESITKEIDNYNQTLAPSDPFGKLGTGLLNNSFKIQDALENSKDSILALQQVVNNFKVLAILPENTKNELLGIRAQVNETVKSISEQQKYLDQLNETRQVAIKSGITDTSGLDSLITRIAKALKDLKDGATKTAEDFSKKIGFAFAQSAIKQLEISSKFATEQAGVAVNRGRIGVLAQAGVDTAKLETDLRTKELNIQNRLIDAQVNLAIQTAKLANEMELSNTLSELSRKREELAAKPKDEKLGNEVKRLEDSVVLLSRQSQLISSGEATSIKGIRKIQLSGQDEDKKALAGSALQSVVSALYGAEAQKAGIEAQKLVARLEGKAKEIDEKTKRSIESFQQQEQPLARELANIQDQEMLVGLYDEQLAQKRLLLEADLDALKLQQEIASVYSQIQKIDLVIADTKSTTEEKNKAELQRTTLLGSIVQKVQNNQQKNDSRNLKALQESRAAKKEIFEVDSKNILSITQAISEQNQLKLEGDELELSRLNAIEGFNKSILIDEKARIDTQKLLQQEQQASYEIDLKRADIEFRRKQLAEDAAKGINTQEQERRLQLETNLLNIQQSSLVTKNSLTLANIEQTRQLNQEQEHYTKQLEVANTLSNNITTAFSGLGTTFERLGTGLSSFVTSLAEAAVQSEKTAKNVVELEANLVKVKEQERNVTEPDDARALYGERVKAEQGITKAKNKQASDEIAANARLVGSTKLLFKEKTTAYKVLNAIEKTMHIQRLAMDAKELFMKLFNIKTGTQASMSAQVKETLIQVNGTLSRLPFYIGEIYAKTFGQLGMFGPPVAAALVAVVSSFLGSKGGGAPVAISSQQRQETQGTAMGYNQAGEKVQVREGVFGDTGAKSESIANSLEILRDNSVVGLDYNDKLLKAFEKLSASIGEAAKAAYGVRGIREGSAFGTIEGTTGGGLFGKKTTTQIIDSGIKIVGMFDQLAAAGGGVIEGFETVQTTTKRTFGRARVRVDTQAFGLDEATIQAINDAFGAASDVIYEVADTLKIDANQVAQTLSTQKVDELVSLRGLTGEALQEQLEAVIGSAVDDASLAVFGSLATAYRKFGEGALETVTRVADTNRKIEQALGNLRGTGIAEDLSFDVTEALADASGGLDKFLDNVDGFTENFLTDAEKLAPVQQSVGRELARLGLSGIKTRDQFKTLVQQLIETKQTGSETFISLLKLQDGFDQVATAAEQALEKTSDALKKAYDDRVSELKSAQTEFKNFAASLRDFQTSLKTGSLSPLTAGEQYEILRREFVDISAKALAGDTAAMAKLQTAGQNFLQASQKMFASGDEYVSDFDLVSKSIDSAASFSEQQVALASNTLTEIKNAVGSLITIEENTASLPAILTGLGLPLEKALIAATSAKAAQEGEPVSSVQVVGGTVAAEIEANAQARIDIANAQTTALAKKLAFVEEELAAIRQAEADRAAAASAFDWSSVGGAAMGMAFDTGGIRKYARGGIVNDVTPFMYSKGLGVMGEAGPEAIMPLRRTPTGDLGVIATQNNSQLVAELARLNQQVTELTKTVAAGANLNAAATERNTQQVVSAVSGNNEKAEYKFRLESKVQVV